MTQYTCFHLGSNHCSCANDHSERTADMYTYTMLTVSFTPPHSSKYRRKMGTSPFSDNGMDISSTPRPIRSSPTPPRRIEDLPTQDVIDASPTPQQTGSSLAPYGTDPSITPMLGMSLDSSPGPDSDDDLADPLSPTPAPRAKRPLPSTTIESLRFPAPPRRLFQPQLPSPIHPSAPTHQVAPVAHPLSTSQRQPIYYYSRPPRFVHLIVYTVRSVAEGTKVPLQEDIHCCKPDSIITLDHKSIPTTQDNPALRLEIWNIPNRAAIPETLTFVVKVLCKLAPRGADTLERDRDGEQRQGSRQVWLKGWAESDQEAAWMIEEQLRTESRSFQHKELGVVEKEWHLSRGKEGWLNRAVKVDEQEGRVCEYQVYTVEVEE